MTSNELNNSIKESPIRHLRLANIGDWEITKEDKECQIWKAIMVISPDNSDSEYYSKPPLAKLTKIKRKHRSSSTSEEDIPLLELQNRINARNRQQKHEYANGEVSSSIESSSESDQKTRCSDHNDDLSFEGKVNQDHTPMHFDSERDEYYYTDSSSVTHPFAYTSVNIFNISFKTSWRTKLNFYMETFRMEERYFVEMVLVT